MSDVRDRVLKLYRSPFRHEMGYVWDADGEMVADDKTEGNSVVNVRGWGRIRYMPDSPGLHDAVGEVIAEALTEYWRKHAPGR
jgi:hypothetical protein